MSDINHQRKYHLLCTRYIVQSKISYFFVANWLLHFIDPIKDLLTVVLTIL